MRFARRAFTLVELLVVIAVIALLMSILLPALKNARETGRSVKELAAVAQLAKISATYSNDFKDAVIPVRIPKFWIWWQVCDKDMYPPDPADPRARITHEAMRTWPWRLVGYSNTPLDGALVTSPREMELFRARGFTGRSVDGNNRAIYPDTSFVGAVAEHPSFGINGVFVGGDTNHSAFKQHGPTRCGFESIIPGTNPHSSGGMFYVAKSSDTRYPSSLITFAASRAGDVSGTGYHGNGGTPADSLTARRDGFYKILPPTSIPSSSPDHGTGYTMMPGWTTTNITFDPNRTQSSWGYLNARHFGTVARACFDGNAKRMTLEELRNMRLWDNFANENTNPLSRVYTWRPR